MLEQLSAVAALQATQEPPPRPQLVTDAALQTPLAQQPLGQDCALQIQAPPMQTVPLPQGGPLPQVQAPATGSQPSLVAALQATQPRPPTPHAVATGTWQTLPAQQPPGHDCALQTQAPPTQVVPAAQPGPAPHRHSPAAEQVSARAGSQVTQAAPPVPQAAVDGVAQEEPEQQPPGQFMGLQSLHTPPAQMRPPQLWQSAPTVPQAVLLVPVRQTLPEQHPLEQEVASQTHAPAAQR